MAYNKIQVKFAFTVSQSEKLENLLFCVVGDSNRGKSIFFNMGILFLTLLYTRFY